MAASINENTRLADDLGLTSFDLADVVVSIEDEYGVSIPDEVFPTLHTCSNLRALCLIYTAGRRIS